LFGRKRRISPWKVEFYDSVYKIYDKDSNLTGYLFPHYPKLQEENEDSAIMKLHNSHSVACGASLMLPMIKLDLLDIEEGQSLDDVLSHLTENIERTKEWREWYLSNKNEYDILECLVYTAREDRQMLSIVMDLGSEFTLGTKEVASFLTPILENLSEQGMI
jgi:hypothetical protein